MLKIEEEIKPSIIDILKTARLIEVNVFAKKTFLIWVVINNVRKNDVP